MENHYFDMFSFESKVFKGEQVNDISASTNWNSFYMDLGGMKSKVALVPTGYAGRADLLSYEAYGTVSYWWLICLANNITNPFEELTSGKQIKIPIID